MYKLFFIAKNNMKKQKGDMVTLFILSCLSAFLIFASLSVLTGMDKVMNAALEKMNGAYLLLFTGDSDREVEAAENALRENERILDYERTPILSFVADYKNAKESDWTEYSFFAGNYDVKCRIMDIRAPEGLSGSDVLLPLYMKSSFSEGDTLQLQFGDTAYDLTVAGYVEDPYFSSTLNITVNYIYISDEMTEKLLQENVARRILHKGTSDESLFTADFTTAEMEKEITDSYKEGITEYLDTNPEYINFLAINWHMMKGGGQFVTQIAMAVILLFAVIVLLVAVVIISFSIRNFIQRNMKNTGILEASGYTVRELRGILLLESGFSAGTGALTGILLGILGSGAIGSVASAMLGLTWNQPVNVTLAILEGVCLLGLVLLVTLVVSRGYKKMTVLDALRGGIAGHNFRKNRFTFEKTPLPTPVVLSLKDTFGGLGRNIALVFIIGILAIFTAVGFGLWRNFGRDSLGMMHLMGFEAGTCQVEAEEGLTEAFRQLDGVDEVMAVEGFEPTVSAKGKEKSIYTYSYDDISKRRSMNLLEGRVPEHDNEAMITPGISDDLKVKVGDMITISYGGRSADYVIVGVNQQVERMGRVIGITLKGLKKIIPGELDSSYYIYAKNGISYEDMENEVKALNRKLSPEKEWNIINIQEMADQTTSMVTMAMKAICIVILIITCLVVLFVESLLIRSKVVREWRNMGVSRALGMTAGELRTQIICSNLPSVIAGSLIGAALAGFVGKKGLLVAFSIFGMKDIGFTIAFPWLLITVIGIILVAVLAAWVSGRKLKTMNPVALITEE